MTATTLAPAPEALAPSRSRFRWAISDTMGIAWRNLITLVRLPQLLIFATIQPVIFVLMFRYVFGGAINVPGIPYVDYLMPGIFTQAVLFNTAFTGVGIASDLQKGLIDRLRSLPMYPAAVLIGRTISDTMRNVITFFVMLVVALLIGFR